MSAKDDPGAQIFDTEDLMALNNCLNEVLHGPSALHDEDFPSRVGIGREEALALFRRIHAMLPVLDSSDIHQR